MWGRSRLERRRPRRPGTASERTYHDVRREPAAHCSSAAVHMLSDVFVRAAILFINDPLARVHSRQFISMRLPVMLAMVHAAAGTAAAAAATVDSAASLCSSSASTPWLNSTCLRSKSGHCLSFGCTDPIKCCSACTSARQILSLARFFPVSQYLLARVCEKRRSMVGGNVASCAKCVRAAAFKTQHFPSSPLTGWTAEVRELDTLWEDERHPVCAA